MKINHDSIFINLFFLFMQVAKLCPSKLVVNVNDSAIYLELASVLMSS